MLMSHFAKWEMVGTTALLLRYLRYPSEIDKSQVQIPSLTAEEIVIKDPLSLGSSMSQQ